MRKTMLIILAAIMIYFCACPAFATNYAASNPYDANVVSLAYMDLDAADTNTQASILQARKVIIENTAWVADGVNGWIEDENGNVLEVVPHFHDVFPADWDVPTYSTDTLEVGTITPRTWQEDFSDSVTLSSTYEEFHTVYTGRFNGKIVDQISTVGRNYGYTYSVQYYNTTTNSLWGNEPDLSSGTAFTLDAPVNATVSIRAKSSRTLGWWMTVTIDRIST